MNTTKELQDAVKAYASGEKERFTQIYELSYKYLHTCVIHIVKDEDVAMDMLQESYIEISRNIHQLQNSDGFLNWAATIANRKCFAYLKKNRDALYVGEESEEFFENIADDEKMIPEEIFQDREKQRLIREVIDELTDVQRLCVIGFYYNEQKQEEIAKELGLPVNTVKSHLNRAKSKIKEAVISLDVKQGTRLYAFAPLLLFVFDMEANACYVPAMSQTIASAAGLVTGGVTKAVAVETAKTIVGTAKAAGMALKTKLALGLAGLCTTALIGTGIYFGTTQFEGLFGDKNEKEVEMTYVFPDDFKSWDTPSRNLAGENRYLYAGGNKITMPTTIGEWEELLGTEFVELSKYQHEGSDEYTIDYSTNKVCVIDKNGVEYFFDVDTSAYVPLDNMEAEMEQLRNTSVIGFDIMSEKGKALMNDSLANYISLVKDVNMFKDDINEVNDAIAAEYGVNVEGNYFTVDRFLYGYRFEWSWSAEGNYRLLDVKYVPEHLLAFYKYAEEAGWWLPGIGELADVTYDGIEELIFFKGDSKAIYAYDWHAGELKCLTDYTQDSIYLDGFMINKQHISADNMETWKKYGGVEGVRSEVYVYDMNGNKIPLISYTESYDGATYCINDKRVTKDVYRSYVSDFVGMELKQLDRYDYFGEYLRNYVDRYYLNHPNFMMKVSSGNGLKIYPHVAKTEVQGEVPKWKENYVALIYEYLSGNASMDNGLVAQFYNNDLTMEEQLKFNLKDINNDGVEELFLHYNQPEYFDEGYFERFQVFLPNGSWNDSCLGTFNMLNASGTEFIEESKYGWTKAIYIYDYDGVNMTFQKELTQYSDGEESYAIRIGDNIRGRSISYAEYAELVARHTETEMQKVEAKPLTIKNLEEALNITIYQLDGNGYKIGPRVSEEVVEMTKEEYVKPEAANSAQEAYEEFLSGKREAIVDYRYSSGKYATKLFLPFELISITEMGERVRNEQKSFATAEFEDVQYAYIDCGNDKEMELAVRFYDADIEEGDSICVLKYRDGQVYITYNLLNLMYESETVLHQNGLMQWSAKGGAGNFNYQWEVLDQNAIRHIVYSGSENFDIFTVDDVTGEWTYYMELASISHNTINGLPYYTIMCASGYDYEIAQESAKRYLQSRGEQNIPLVREEKIVELRDELLERYHASNENRQKIDWRDLSTDK